MVMWSYYGTQTQIYIYTAIYCAFDPETGEQLFSESDYKQLLTKSSKALEAIISVGNDLNAIGDENIGEMVKNWSIGILNGFFF